jgi:ABC-type nitrate/sulfonate/bicarbonate transport system substrate-binding protein
MVQIDIGGVPEHFNLPWHLGIDHGIFKKNGVDLRWHEYNTGTGDMVKALASYELDAAVVLTEGIVQSILKGNSARIFDCFVQTPLHWGVHVNSSSFIQSAADLAKAKVAISRFGSGSHLMAAYFFEGLGQKLQPEDFVIVNNLEGARKALNEDGNLVFFWEQFTTQWLVNIGEFRRIAICPTPWPCFMLAVSQQAWAEKQEALISMFTIVQQQVRSMLQLDSLIAILADRYKMTSEEAEQWLLTVKWNVDSTIKLAPILQLTQQTLFGLGLVDSLISPNQFLLNP